MRRTKAEDLFVLLVEKPLMSKKKKESLSQEAPEEYGAFVVWFLEKNKIRINRCAYKRTIPNRYSIEDIKSYIAQTILTTLRRREAVGRAIKEPKLYFSKLIDFYCVEFQRMHGYIYGLPKRPRAPKAETEISQYGFCYLESNVDIGYVDNELGDDSQYFGNNYQDIGNDNQYSTEAWDSLMKNVLPEESEILSCLYGMNMSIPEASKHLGIAVSTAYQRAYRGLTAISGAVAESYDLTKSNWKLLTDIATSSNNPTGSL
jgi:hypothetical protein